MGNAYEDHKDFIEGIIERNEEIKQWDIEFINCQYLSEEKKDEVEVAFLDDDKTIFLIFDESRKIIEIIIDPEFLFEKITEDIKIEFDEHKKILATPRVIRKGTVAGSLVKLKNGEKVVYDSKGNVWN